MREDSTYVPLLGEDEEKPDVLVQQNSHPKRSSYCVSSSVHRILWAFGVLGIVICSFLAGIQYGISLAQIREVREVVAGGSQRLVPSFTVEARKFRFEKQFAHASLQDAEKVWSSMIPKGQGWIRLPIVNEYNSTIYNIAAYHQLHCLFGIRRDFYQLLSLASSSEATSVDLNTTLIDMHGSHCFEYLRNALTCNADLTLEPYMKKEKMGKVWNLNHQCVDFEALSKWATLVRTSNAQGISEATISMRMSH